MAEEAGFESGGEDTIAALATAPGLAAVAIVRVSGPETRNVLKSLSGRLSAPRRASLRTLRDAGGDTLDQALVLWFAAPHSFTGEDAAELHLHGGRYVVESTLAALISLGVRLAAPGEFSRRAFANGKLDLIQAEAMADLIDAESQAQARQALEQLRGSLGARYTGWRNILLASLARLEVLVDFPDEDIAEATAGLESSLLELATTLEAALRDGARGQWVRDGYRVAIVGPPNAGKSSLFNELVGREAVIVADQPGTTRDVIEARLNLTGYWVVLADTAGLRTTSDVVEAEGVRRARSWADSAARRLWVYDGSCELWTGLEDVDLWRGGDLCILSKADRPLSAQRGELANAAKKRGLEVAAVSVLDGGVATVRKWLERDVERAMAGADFPAVTRRRHSLALTAAAESVRRAADAIRRPELACEDLRLAARSLSSVTGEIATEDILGEVFASFCIGK